MERMNWLSHVFIVFTAGDTVWFVQEGSMKNRVVFWHNLGRDDLKEVIGTSLSPARVLRQSLMSKAGPGELPAYLLHLATLQLLCRAAPFTHARTLPLHTLSDLAADYIHLLATAAKSNAELAGRNQTTIWDLGRALEEFGTGTLGELRDEMEKGGGGTEEGLRLRSIAGGLKGLFEFVIG